MADRWPHLVSAGWVIGMLLFARADGEAYAMAMQEDAFVEWLTTFLFLAAAVASFTRRRALSRPGDLLVALFCIAAAGEEISWGQRIFSYVPSETFLARNAQQEANLHNLVEAFGEPKWSLIAIMIAYAVCLPLAARSTLGRRAVERIRVTPPKVEVAGWFVVAIALEIVYPVRFAGEWIEALVGGLFVWGISASARLTGVALMVSSALAALALAGMSAVRAADAARVECAAAETRAIVGALERMGYPGSRRSRLHRRLGTIWPDSRVDPAIRDALATIPCERDQSRITRRRNFGIDPWGNAYWVRIEPDASGPKLRVYSFGPNRRRDHDRIGVALGDDVSADAVAR